MTPNYQIECIPNVSSADPKLVARITKAIQAVPEVDLRFVDPGQSANRTVFTYLGPVQAVFQATEQLIRIALEGIDMRTQQGVHPRMGAVDVCPFVLLDDASYATDLISRTEQFGLSLAQSFNLPIYFYEHNSTTPIRQNLANVRRGEYEGLPERYHKGDLPDLGPQTWDIHAQKHGATALGVRPLMVAYNMNLRGLPNDTLRPIAEHIARALREKNSGLAGVKAIAWYLADFDLVQVSCNLTKPWEVGVCEVFDRAKELATEAGCIIRDSELIGCIPRSQFTTHTASDLGFGQLKPFNERRILPF